MTRWKVAGMAAVLTIAALASVAGVMAQEGGPAGWGGGRGRWDPEQMRQRMAERMRESLGATEEEWTIIGPRLEAVQTLSREAGGGGMFGMFGRGRGMRGPWGGPADEGAEVEQSAIEEATDALRTTLEDEASTAAQIKEKLTAYRAAREKARQELATAQEELREVLSVRQEAQLVLMGMLD